MALEGVLRGSDPIQVKRVTILLYGDPGLGKTTLASTSSNPIMIDTDESAHRAVLRDEEGALRCAVMPVSNWAQLTRMSVADFEGYDTIIVDTLGTSLDMAALQIGGGRALSVNQWGILKSQAGSWLDMIRGTGKDIVYVAHSIDKKIGDVTFAEAHIPGGTKQTVMRQADMIGRLYSTAEGTMLSFNPSPGGIGKNSARVPDSLIKDVSEIPDMLAKVISRAKEVMNLGQ